MPIEFSATANTSAFEQKMNTLPGKAAAVGKKIGDSLDAGLRKSANMDYANRMKSGMAAMMAEGEKVEDKSRAKRREKEKAENARAQMELDRFNERKEKAAQKQAEKDETRAKKQERTLSMARVAGLAYIGKRVVDTAKEFGDMSNQQIANGGGLTRELSEQANLWRQMAASATTVTDRMELQSKMSGDIQSQMDKMRNEDMSTSTTEDIFNAFQWMTGGETTFQNKMAAQTSKIGAMERQAASNAAIAKRNQDYIETTLNQKDFTGRDEEFSAKVRALRDENAGLDPTNPGQLRRMQRNEAEAKALTKYRNASRDAIDTERKAAEAYLNPLRKREALTKDIAKLQDRMSGATMEERLELEKQVQAKQIERGQSDIALAGQQLDIGLMGAGGRREAARQMRREQREQGRQERLRASGQHDARAFAGKLLNYDRQMMLAAGTVKELTKPTEDLLAVIKDRLKFPVLK